MGGEGSETLKQAHINMAQRFYCNEDVAYANTGMMGNYNTGMMRGSGIRGSGMMGGYGYSYRSITWLFYIAIAAFVFGFVFWWTYRLVGRDKRRTKKD